MALWRDGSEIPIGWNFLQHLNVWPFQCAGRECLHCLLGCCFFYQENISWDCTALFNHQHNTLVVRRLQPFFCSTAWQQTVKPNAPLAQTIHRHRHTRCTNPYHSACFITRIKCLHSFTIPLAQHRILFFSWENHGTCGTRGMRPTTIWRKQAKILLGKLLWSLLTKGGVGDWLVCVCIGFFFSHLISLFFANVYRSRRSRTICGAKEDSPYHLQGLSCREGSRI